MKIEHKWGLACFLIGLVLGGARCSYHSFDSKPGCKPDVQITYGEHRP